MKHHPVLRLLVWTCAGVALLGSCAGNPSSAKAVVQANIEMPEVNVNSVLMGKATDVTVKEGDTVKNGQVLVVLDSETIRNQLAQAQARLAGAEAQRDSTAASLELAESSFARVKQMWQSKGITQAEYDDATTKLRQAKSGLASVDAQVLVAKAALQEIQSNVDKTSILAPMAGVVTQVNIKKGELVSTGMPLAVISDLDSPWVQCSIKETDLSRVNLGKSVDITIPAYKDLPFRGKIVRINKNADFAIKRASNDNGDFDVLSYSVKIELEKSAQQLYAGMTVFVDLGSE